MLTLDQKAKLSHALNRLSVGPIYKDGSKLSLLVDALSRFFSHYNEWAQGPNSTNLPKTINMDSFLAEHEADPRNTASILTAATHSCTPPVLSMMWMVLHGATITALNYTYSRDTTSRLSVTIRFPDQNETMTTISSTIWDVAIIKLASLELIDDQPVLKGFQAFLV